VLLGFLITMNAIAVFLRQRFERAGETGTTRRHENHESTTIDADVSVERAGQHGNALCARRYTADPAPWSTRDVCVFYGDKQALFDVEPRHPRTRSSR
jgi:hypothetical protein